MGSDFSRRIFDKTRNYTGALLQQGRVILDSDWNERVGHISTPIKDGDN